MRLHRVKWLLAVALLCLSAVAGAHRFHTGITEISFNPRTGSTEIVHTYMAHDIDALLLNTYGRQFDLLDPDDQAVLRKYVEAQFVLKGADGARLPVRWIGVSANAQSVVIYQEIENAPLAKTATVRQGVLIDFLRDQINTVNFNNLGTIHSLTFSQSSLEQPAPTTSR